MCCFLPRYIPATKHSSDYFFWNAHIYPKQNCPKQKKTKTQQKQKVTEQTDPNPTNFNKKTQLLTLLLSPQKNSSLQNPSLPTLKRFGIEIPGSAKEERVKVTT